MANRALCSRKVLTSFSTGPKLEVSITSSVGLGNWGEGSSEYRHRVFCLCSGHCLSCLALCSVLLSWGVGGR